MANEQNGALDRPAFEALRTLLRERVAATNSSVRGLSQRTGFHRSQIQRALNGSELSLSENLAWALDTALAADGKIIAARERAYLEQQELRRGFAVPAPAERAGSGEELGATDRREALGTLAVTAAGALVGALAAGGNADRGPSLVRQALETVSTDCPGLAETAAEMLDELVAHYAELVTVAAPAHIYQDLLGVRAYAGASLRTMPSAGRTDVVAAAGWLSVLLAVTTSNMGDHAAAVVWCRDAERRSREAGLPEIAGWASLTKATMAYYQGQAHRSARLCAYGYQFAPAGTAVSAKLAAQEMRARALLGDANGMTRARTAARKALAQLRPNSAPTGYFSIRADADDPPYTATSLLHAGRFHEAAAITRRIVDAAPTQANELSASHARALLILALAEAGLGNTRDAATVGLSALGNGAPPVWPTLVLAGKLDRALAGSPHAAGFRTVYRDSLRHALSRDALQGGDG